MRSEIIFMSHVCVSVNNFTIFSHNQTHIRVIHEDWGHPETCRNGGLRVNSKTCHNGGVSRPQTCLKGELGSSTDVS